MTTRECTRDHIQQQHATPHAREAAFISSWDTIRKVILRVSIAVCPWSPRPHTEPAGRADHALHRDRRLRARLARQTRCSMAAVQLRHRRSSEVTLRDAVWAPHGGTCIRLALRPHSLACTECGRGESHCTIQYVPLAPGASLASRAGRKQRRPAEHDSRCFAHVTQVDSHFSRTFRTA